MISDNIQKVSPEWSEISRPISMAKLLDRLSDKEVVTASVSIWQGIAYIILYHCDAEGTNFYRMGFRDWEMVKHIIFTNPTRCRCWACDWRIKRQRFRNIGIFDHLWKSEITEIASDKVAPKT